MNLQMPMRPFIKQRCWYKQNELFMKLRNTLFKIMAIVAVVFTFLSCDNEFSPVGGEIIGGVNFQDSLYVATPVAYSKKFERVQTNGLIRDVQGVQTNFQANLLGVYNDPIYGPSEYSILSQVQPSEFDPDFGTNPVLDKVILSLPYFSTVESTESQSLTLGSGEVITETVTKYTLDSIYQNNSFRLSVFQSNYFLRNFDPSSNERQIYYSDDIANFGSQVEGDGTPLVTVEDFIPSPDEIIIDEIVKDVDDLDSLVSRSRLSPRLRIELPVQVFKEQFIDKQGGTELSNADNFNNYFRGIYIKAEPTNGTGNLLYLNVREGNITLQYTADSDTQTDDAQTDNTTEREQREFTLSFTGNIINSITTQLEPTIAEELKAENQDQVNGEENLYLKGGDGSFAVIDLFNKCVEFDDDGNFILDENGGPIFIDCPAATEEKKTELDFLKSQNWLINDASLKFYINQDVVTAGETEPERIYVFNLETGGVIADYGLDANFQLFDQNNPINSIPNHLGRISRDADDAGEFYRISLTQHIINLLGEDTDNIKLGVSVSQNVNAVVSVVGDTSTTNDEIIPNSSIISHEGTILYGNGASVPESKRLKLEIFYTESTNN